MRAFLIACLLASAACASPTEPLGTTEYSLRPVCPALVVLELQSLQDSAARVWDERFLTAGEELRVDPNSGGRFARELYIITERRIRLPQQAPDTAYWLSDTVELPRREIWRRC